MKTDSPNRRSSLKHIVIAGAAIFVLAFGVRLFSWHDTRRDVAKVQAVVAADYQHAARLLREGGARGFFATTGPLADPNLLGHPPGYPILIAFIWSLFGESNTAIQTFQIACDAAAAVFIFLIAIELFPFAVGVIAASLVALSPQLSWNAVLLLPDTLAAFPLILAVYLLLRAFKKPGLFVLVAAGICIGLSCWLRANALFMGPFLAVVFLFVFDSARRWRHAGVFLAAVLFAIAPLTIRNWIVFDHFIPVSLGAGQTMLEGISDYDPDRRFGIPDTDMGIMKMEAEQYNRPDYYSTLFAPDGIKRERQRLARGARIVADHPVWFVSVMIRRAGSMLRLERTRLISSRPPVTRDLKQGEKAWVADAAELLKQANQHSARASLAMSSDGQTLRITSDNSRYGNQMTTGPITVKQHHDYVMRLPVLVEEGRISVSAVELETGTVYDSTVIEKAEVKEGQPQPVNNVELAFVNGSDKFIKLEFNNAVPRSGHSIAQVGTVELYDLGRASLLWMRYPRTIVRGLQRLFVTAVMLPLALFGIFLVARRRAWKTLAMLFAVPAYYLLAQSALHTEYRYVLVIHYFLFIFVALTLYQIYLVIFNQVQTRLPRRKS